MIIGFSMAISRGTGVASAPPETPPIERVGTGATAAGATVSYSGLQDQDYVLILNVKTSANTTTSPPTGNPLGYTQLASARASATSLTLFGLRVTSDMLTDGAFASGTFVNAGSARIFIMAYRNVLDVTTGAGSPSDLSTRTTRPFSAITGLTSRSWVFGACRLTGGTAPIPAGASNFITDTSRLWDVGPVDTWAPAAAADGSNVDFKEVAVGLL